MSRIRTIRLETLNQDLEKLENDYKAVADKKRRESNPQEQNNLQLQLDDIAKRINAIEKEMNQLQQPEQGENNIQILLILLIPYEDKISNCVKRIYQTCSPDDWQNPLPDKLEGILVELKKMPQGESKYTVIEKFIARLVIDSEIPQSLSEQLKIWAKSNINGYSELLKLISTQIQELTNKTPYLIVAIRRSEQDSLTNPNKEDCYFLNAWLIPDANTYNSQNNSGCKQLFYPKNVIETKQSKLKNKETLTLKQIPQAINIFLNQIGEYSSSKLIIEIFLPLELINEAVDCWEIENEFGLEEIKLNRDYKVVVRSTERLLPTYSRYKGFWQEKWQTLQKIIKTSVLSAFVLWNDDDLKKLSIELRKENAIGIKLQQTPIKTGKGSVFAVILSTATPVALWLRCHLPECNHQVDGLLECCIEELTEAIAQKRLEALLEPENSHIGHHLSLLWEDPYRLPPSIDYSM
ncbi:hypothetical protein CDG77_10530 [Nostoc sp. 'Peltigera membranacea cyanobiont' 213]|uniref:VMAP-C domain-containing protein n=1 Tax=Nostoc sp. 'Peltigera membranacea cyanobiont' 213 TaxID=2014530 RepID=UPI000B95877A|nr:hypothetical protein [Nostoc sp. 'Peltigera membranacea cyanobiont' 213]OYD95153.1 hypothetical protein CDG77_10530 [Nostoc sp. 'Peltigera membranacea cyanobiont' 213]